MTAQVLGRGLGDRPRVPERLHLTDRSAESGARRAYFGRAHGWIDTPVVARAALAGGGEGPCIVEEYDSTCLVPPGVRATVDASGNLVLTRPDP